MRGGVFLKGDMLKYMGPAARPGARGPIRHLFNLDFLRGHFLHIEFRPKNTSISVI